MLKKHVLIMSAVLLILNVSLHGAAAAAASGGASAESTAPITRARKFADEHHLTVDPAVQLVRTACDGTLYYETEAQRKKLLRANVARLAAAREEAAYLHRNELIDRGVKALVAAEVRALGHTECRPLSMCATCYPREEILYQKVREAFKFLRTAHACERARRREVKESRKMYTLFSDHEELVKLERDDEVAQAAYRESFASAQALVSAVYEAGQKHFDQAAQEEQAAKRNRHFYTDSDEESSEEPTIRTVDDGDAHMAGAAAMADDPRASAEAKETRALAGVTWSARAAEKAVDADEESDEESTVRTYSDGDAYMAGAAAMADDPRASAEAKETRALAGGTLSARAMERAVDADADHRTWYERFLLIQLFKDVQRARELGRAVSLLFARARLTMIRNHYPQLLQRDDVKAAAAFIAEASQAARKAVREKVALERARLQKTVR